MTLKPFLRVVAFDDGYFKPKSRTQTPLIGVIYRFDNSVEGIISTQIKVDSLDSTQKISSLILKSKFLDQIYFILLSGINFAGFNIVDLGKLYKQLEIPIIVVMRKFPNFKKISTALKRFKDSKKRMKLIEQGGEIHKYNSIYFQFIGCEKSIAQQVLKKTIVNANIPEPLRLAHLIASGVTLGQSTRP